MENEIWKDVIGYEGLYQVSSFGRVRSLNYNRTRSSELMKIGTDKDGYQRVTLSKGGRVKTVKVHSLIAKVFINSDYIINGLVVNHKDFNRKNNFLSNLEVITVRENTNKKHLKSSSKYTGVCLRLGKWDSRIMFNKKELILGRFDTEIEASNYYEDALICIKEGRVGDIVVKKSFK